MSTNTYLALTIGPIYETFEQSKRTRSVWAASYFFSWFIKQIVDRSHKIGFKILLPHHIKETHESEFGSGLYADRIYFEPSENGKEDIKAIIDNLICELDNDFENEPGKFSKYLKDYLNIHIVESDISDKNQVLKTLNAALDQRELTKSFVFEDETNYLLNYLDTKLSENNLISSDAFKNKPGLRFRSIPEIATSSLERVNSDGYKTIIDLSYKASRKNLDFEIIDAIKENNSFSKLLKPYHKYYAVLYADGDNIGDLLKMVAGNFSELKEFSRLLFEFGKEAEEIIENYGGNGIYLGGEDILAFLPMACLSKDKTHTNSLFDLINDLDIAFDNTLGKYAALKGVKSPTLSYGIMISYYKQPLKESMKLAHNLMDSAKDLPHESKDTIGLRFQKHSGQYMECHIEKCKNISWDEIRSFTFRYTQQPGENNEGILSGLIHRLKDDVFFSTLSISARNKRLAPFFDNFFNEFTHHLTANEEFIINVSQLVEKVFEDYPNDEEGRRILYTVLRYCHFINSNKD